MVPDALTTLNRLPAGQAAERLAACNASPAWVATVLADRPYADTEALLALGERAARDLTWDEVRAALEAHPRIGERATGASTEASWSRQEQAAAGTGEATEQVALRAGNAAYEDRFGHVFLIRASGRSAGEILADLRRRLAHDPEREREEVREQLAQITRLRLERMLRS